MNDKYYKIMGERAHKQLLAEIVGYPQPEQEDDFDPRLEMKRGVEQQIAELEEVLEEAANCDGCHPGYVRCRTHGEVALMLSEKRKELKEYE